MLLANYFFMSETLISSLSALQNSIHLNRDTTRSQDSQDVKECFTNSVRSSTQPTANLGNLQQNRELSGLNEIAKLEENKVWMQLF
jgi:hypothetical protein